MNNSSYVFFFKQKTAYEMRISDWSSDVCSSDLPSVARERQQVRADEQHPRLRLRQHRGELRGSQARVEGVAHRAHPHDAIPSLDMSLRVPRKRRDAVARPDADRGEDRKSGGEGKSVSVRVALGGRRIIKKKNTIHNNKNMTDNRTNIQ